MRWWISSIVLGATVLAACSTPVTTELVVVVASDYLPGDEVSRVVITTVNESGATIGTRDVTVTASGGSGSVTLPFSFGVTPAGDAARPLRIAVQAFEAGASEPFVTRRAVAPFVAGQTRRLVVFLERACEGVSCDAPSTCVHGGCASADVSVTELGPVMPGSELVVDGGPHDFDGGVRSVCADMPTCDRARHVEVGVGFACAVRRTTGRVACWGTEAALGQLGNGTTTASTLPVEATGITDASEIVLGDRFGCAASESQLWCWGDNAVGQLGGSDAASSPVPVMVGLSAARLFSGASIACADAASTCWGGTLTGIMLTLPDTCSGSACARHPAEQSSLALIDALSDEGHTCVIQSGVLACAGANTFGEVGDGTHEAREGVNVIDGLDTAWSVATTARSTCAITASVPPDLEDAASTVRCWGAGDLGQLAAAASDRCGDVPCSVAPVAVAGVTQALELAATGDTFCARTGAGPILCWGSDEHGELGDGIGAPDRCTTTDGRAIRCALAPTVVRGIDAIDLDARGGTFCAVRRDGGVSCWGAGYGELPRDVGALPR